MKDNSKFLYPIEKGIPIPEPKKGGPRKFPWRFMKIGDSFLVEGDRNQSNISALASQAARRLNMKFTTRKEDSGIRVWRIA